MNVCMGSDCKCIHISPLSLMMHAFTSWPYGYIPCGGSLSPKSVMYCLHASFWSMDVFVYTFPSFFNSSFIFLYHQCQQYDVSFTRSEHSTIPADRHHSQITAGPKHICALIILQCFQRGWSCCSCSKNQEGNSSFRIVINAHIFNSCMQWGSRIFVPQFMSL